MLKKFLITALLSGVFGLSFLNSAEPNLANDDKIIRIGVTPNPFEILVSHLKDDFKAKGYELKVVEFNDYNLPNRALEDKDLDANLFQHKPFLDEYIKAKGAKLVPITPVVVAPMAIFSNKIKDLKELKDGAKVSVPSDPTNENRALELLAKTGLIELNDKPLKTILDIVKNPKNLNIAELKAAQLPRTLDEVDIAVINSNYALGAGLNPSKDSIFIEDKDSPYTNVVVVRAGEENSPKSKVIDELLRSEKLRKFINEKYDGVLIPSF